MSSAKGAGPHATHPTEETKRQLDHLIAEVRKHIESVHEPRAQALFETTAEVLGGLRTAYEHYEEGEETAFQH